MSDLTSRRSFVTLAAGAAAVAAAVPAASATPTSASPLEAAAQAAREAAARLSPAPERRPKAVTTEARVLLCRSWDSTVYLHAGEDLKGFVSLSPEAFAIAAAAQAANRPLAVRCWGHERDWAGVGRFDGVLLAFDLRDLPAEPLL